ncbi:MAG TPA: peptidyl-alpha-hydroxyglycine alpha-amidating lyase family protein [Pyrinomonadaceae bacterium]
MKLVYLFTIIGIATVGVKSGINSEVQRDFGTVASSMGYHVVHGWPVLPENSVLDEVSAVAVNSSGNVLVLQRGGRKWPESDVLDQTPIGVPTVFVFDGSTGRLLRKWGANLFALPHSVTVDRQDNVWITDVALNQVFKFSHDGRLVLTVGERGIAGQDHSHFNRPTDVAVASDGSFYVSDGYGNSRVIKFDSGGKFLNEWGKKGREAGQFDLPHGIALDRSGRVFVVDRGNARIQVFDGKGNYLAQWNGPFVSPQDIAIANDGTTFVVDIGDDKLPDRSGLLLMRQDGSLAARFGRYGNYDGQFLVAHGVAVGQTGEVYVADFSGRRVQKFARNKR